MRTGIVTLASQSRGPLTLHSAMSTLERISCVDLVYSLNRLLCKRIPREQYGISDGLIRMSIGLESTDDILDDLARALEQLVS